VKKKEKRPEEGHPRTVRTEEENRVPRVAEGGEKKNSHLFEKGGGRGKGGFPSRDRTSETTLH